MNKNKILQVFFFILVLSGCNKDFNRTYFTINPENRYILVPVHINDSVTANMIFDSRAFFTLDSSFCVSNNINLNNPDIIQQTGSGWTYRSVQGFLYDKSPDVKIGNVNLIYSNIEVYNLKGFMNCNQPDGIFGVPPQDTIHVWELNFEHNYLEIHSATGFKMPNNCFVVPVEEDQTYSFFVQLPIHIKCANGDTLAMNHLYYVDTGMYNDLAVIYPAEEITFFNKKEDATWIRAAGGNSYSRYYTVNATLFGHYHIDSLRVYTFDDPRHVTVKYLIGQNFLMRFNVFFDLKNRQMGFQPIKNFQRVVNPLPGRFHYSTKITQDGKTIVSKIADYPANCFKKAGLQEGDEIIAVNGLPYINYSRDYLHYDANTFLNVLRDKNTTYEDYHFFKGDTLIFDIFRQRIPMKIIVPIDKTECQGID